MLHICVWTMLILKPVKREKKVHTKLKYKVKNRSCADPAEGNAQSTENTELRKDRPGTIQEMTIGLSRNFSFTLLLFNTSMFFGLTVVYTHIFTFAASQGMGLAVRGIMASVIGVSALAGRLILSAIMQQPRINTIILYIVSVFSLVNF